MKKISIQIAIILTKVEDKKCPTKQLYIV